MPCFRPSLFRFLLVAKANRNDYKFRHEIPIRFRPGRFSGIERLFHCASGRLE